jgi:hypothetical protein
MHNTSPSTAPVLLTFALSLLWSPTLHAQCSDGSTTTTNEYSVPSRDADNDVWTYAQSFMTGAYAQTWTTYVSATATHNSSQTHSGNSTGNAGALAQVSWHDAPSSVGSGTYAIASHHSFQSTCGNSSQYNYSFSLNVTPPTISGLSGGWLFGSVDDPDNGYYKAVALSVSHNCTASDSPGDVASCSSTPYWTAPVNGSKITFSCTSCSNTNATSVQPSGTCGDISIRANVGGLLSTSFPFTVNTMRSWTNRGYVDSNFGAGYRTRYSYQLTDVCSNYMPRVVTNETFGSKVDLWAAGHQGIQDTWTALQSGGFAHPDGFWPSGITYDYLVASYTASQGTPATVHPGDPGADAPVMSQTQTWRVGSATVGEGISAQSATMVNYLGHARVQ